MVVSESVRPFSRGPMWLVAAVALVVRLVVCLWAFARVPPSADGKFYHVVAERIAQGDGYTWLWPDGSVTFAAHYPIGYPALMGGVYALLGPVPGYVMIVNGVLGALSIASVYALCSALVLKSPWASEAMRVSVLVALALSFSPTLVGYTPALMTEGVVGALLIFAAHITLLLSRRAGDRSWGRALWVGLALLLAAATLVRPQSVLMAPILGALAMRGSCAKRFLSATLVSIACLSAVAPWTLRNCDKMERCVFVSANGGWNLLIGTFIDGKGAWLPVSGERIPPECAEVYQEAAKDSCFGEAAVRRIRESPGAWLSLIPAKLRATFDYSAAATEYLAEAGVLGGSRHQVLQGAEFVGQRLLLLLALLGVWATATGVPSLMRYALGTLGLVGFLGAGAWLGWLAVAVLVMANSKRLLEVAWGYAFFSLISTAVLHALFFGAGRYSLPLLLATAPLSALGLAFLLKRAQFFASVR